MACPINFKKQQKSSFRITAIFFTYYDVSRLQVVVFFFPENVCESLIKAQHLFFDAVNIVMNL